MSTAFLGESPDAEKFLAYPVLRDMQALVMKTRLSQSRQIKTQTPTGTTVRFCATVEPEVLEDAHQVAKLSGFKFSFSAYVNDLLKRDVEQRRAHMATCARA